MHTNGSGGTDESREMGGEGLSCGTLDIVSFLRLAVKRTVVPLWVMCVCVCDINVLKSN